MSTEVIQAPHKFSADEIAAMNITLRQSLSRIEILEGQRKSAQKDYALRIQNEKNGVQLLVMKLESGEEPRSITADVTYDTKRGMKAFHYPDNGEFIREEQMSDADWQLPMFRKEEVESFERSGLEAAVKNPEIFVPEGCTAELAVSGRVVETHQLDNGQGTTPIGDVLDQVASLTEAPKIVLDLTKEDWEARVLVNAYKKAAKKAGWSEPQIALLSDQLKACDTVSAMIDTLRPHAVAAIVE